MTITFEVEIDKQKVETFRDLITFAFQLAMAFGRALVVAVLEQRDQELRELRDVKRFRCKGRRKTSVKTKLGVIEFRRYVYVDNAAAERVRHVYLLDEDLGIEKVGLAAADICQLAATAVCESSYRNAAKQITEMTGLSISAQGVWNIVQDLGGKRAKQIERHAELARKNQTVGCVSSKILYEENDGVWLKLQGKSREEFGKNREMKVGIAYDGATWEIGKAGRKRRTLDCKVAYASFENAPVFRRHKEGVIGSRYNVDEIELRVINGDGAQWIHRRDDVECITVLDEFHRNKKITECVEDEEFAKLLRGLLYENRVDDVLICIEAQINSIEDEAEKARLNELYAYYANNKESLLGYYDRGIKIPETRAPGVVHHARLGSMESNVFTLIGNRMKNRRACWSICGGSNLALLLCAYHTTGFEDLFVQPSALTTSEEQPVDNEVPLSASKAPKKDGKGTLLWQSSTLPNIPWLKSMTGYQSILDIKIR